MSLYDDLMDRISTSNTLDADHINDGMELTETFLNAGITAKEMQDKSSSDHVVFENEGWVGPEHIYRPEFYGSPSPRMVAVSGQTHFRETSNSTNDGVIFSAQTSGTGFIPIPCATTSIKLRQSATVNIMASFYGFEFGGVNPANKYLTYWFDSSNGGYENRIAAYVYLRVNDNVYGGTRRDIYVSTVGGRSSSYDGSETLGGHDGGSAGKTAINGFLEFPMIGRHQHFLNYQLNLAEGVHDIGLVCYPIKDSETGYNILTHYAADYQNKYGFVQKPFLPYRKLLFFQARNFIVDAYYRDFDPE